jgi:hypothetical protein
MKKQYQLQEIVYSYNKHIKLCQLKKVYSNNKSNNTKKIKNIIKWFQTYRKYIHIYSINILYTYF